MAHRVQKGDMGRGTQGASVTPMYMVIVLKVNKLKRSLNQGSLASQNKQLYLHVLLVKNL